MVQEDKSETDTHQKQIAKINTENQELILN